MRAKLINKFIICLPIIFLLTVASSSAQEKSDVFYQLTAEVYPQEKSIISTATISFPKLLSAKEQKIYLRLRALKNNSTEKIQPQIKRISDEQGRELKFISGQDPSVITLALSPSQQEKPVKSITIEYSVPFSENDVKNLGYYLYPSHDTSNYWYPILLDEKEQNIRFADYEVSLVLPKNYEALTSGLRISKIQEGNLIKSRFAANHIEGFSLAFGENYQLQEVEKDGIRVSAFSSADVSAKFLEIARQSADAAAWYQKTYGFFPTRNIGVVSGYKTASGGYPIPNLFMIHQGRLYPDFTQNTTAHELGHYLWGLYVFSDKEFLDWMMLANGIWIDHLYLAEKSGESLEKFWQGYNQELFNWFEFYRVAEIANYDQRLDIAQEEEMAFDYDYHSYVRHAKGAVGVYLQARLIGKDKFLALQKRILTEYRYRPLSTDDFIGLLTKSGSPNAAEFFKVWRRGDATIGYKIAGVERIKSSLNTFRYNITVNRTGNVPYPVEVEIHEANGKRSRLTFSGLKETEKIETTQNSAITEVLLDPDGILPIWNSANKEIQAVNIRAMFRAEAGEPAVILAADYLKKNPKDELTRSMLIDEFMKTGRFHEIKQLFSNHQIDSCSDRSSCLSLINLATALSEEGRTDDAAVMINKIREMSEEFGLGRRWQSLNTRLNLLKK